MSSELGSYVNSRIQVITHDGRVLLGTLKGVDQTTNLILENAFERLFSVEGSKDIQLGLELIRGDVVMVIGPVDSEVENEIDWKHLKCDPLKPLEF